MRIVIFTGAGAAKADGLPLQAELFQEFFSRAALRPSRAELARDIGQIFDVVFGIGAGAISSAILPTFEEALGILDLAMSREEGLLGLGGPQPYESLRHLRRQLILALAATIARDPTAATSFHSQLIASLRNTGVLGDVTFVTTNYDTLLDDAIEGEAVAAERGIGSLVDYGFAGLVPSDTGEYVERRTVPCYKIHGSLNWLHCGVCNTLAITYGLDGVTHLIDEPDAALCIACEAIRTPVIVPPSYYKNTSNVHLAVVWEKTFKSLCETEHVIFCGYSFPDADMHVKYLLKRAQLNRSFGHQNMRFTIVNQHAGKGDNLAATELGRFARFLGSANVSDSRLSFEQFASNPSLVL